MGGLYNVVLSRSLICLELRSPRNWRAAIKFVLNGCRSVLLSGPLDLLWTGEGLRRLVVMLRPPNCQLLSEAKYRGRCCIITPSGADAWRHTVIPSECSYGRQFYGEWITQNFNIAQGRII